MRLLLILPLFLILAACSSGDEELPYAERPVEDLYNSALDELEDGSYRQSALLFNEVERQHPYSSWATRAQLMAAFAHYEALRYDEALDQLDRFIALHPGHQQAPYAFYLRALCYYEQIADVRRDQTTTQLALDALNELIRRFPDSPYARDAQLKVDLTQDHLAAQHMSVGRYYQGQDNHHAALMRFAEVVDSYDETSHAAEALHRMVESYMALGLPREARRSAAVLGHNYPNSVWYEDSYDLIQRDETGADLNKPDDQPGFFSRAWDSFF